MSQRAYTWQPWQRKGWKAWFDVRGRHLGYVAFALNRLTALGLLLYLGLHLVVLSMLTSGPETWDNFIRLAKSPFFLLLDVVLLTGLLYHGLNGLRVALVGIGIGVRHHKTLFWVLMAVAALFLVLGTWGFLTV